MPEIPVRPGEWDDLLFGVIRVCLNPASYAATEDIEKAWTGFALHGFLKHFGGEKLTLTQSDLDTLAAGQADSVPLGVKMEELSYGLMTAGHVLTYTLRLKRHLPRLASAEAAMKIVSWQYQKDGWPAGATYIKSAWRKYRPIAHFIGGVAQAAEDFKILGSVFPAPAEMPKGESTEITMGRNWFGTFKADLEKIVPHYKTRNTVFAKCYAYSEALRRQGEAHHAQNQERKGRPLLDPETTWWIPTGFELPQVTLSLPDLDPADRQAAAGVN